MIGAAAQRYARWTPAPRTPGCAGRKRCCLTGNPARHPCKAMQAYDEREPEQVGEDSVFRCRGDVRLAGAAVGEVVSETLVTAESSRIDAWHRALMPPITFGHFA